MLLRRSNEGTDRGANLETKTRKAIARSVGSVATQIEKKNDGTRGIVNSSSREALRGSWSGDYGVDVSRYSGFGPDIPGSTYRVTAVDIDHWVRSKGSVGSTSVVQVAMRPDVPRNLSVPRVRISADTQYGWTSQPEERDADNPRERMRRQLSAAAVVIQGAGLENGIDTTDELKRLMRAYNEVDPANPLPKDQNPTTFWTLTPPDTLPDFVQAPPPAA